MWVTIAGLLGLHELRLRCGFRIPRLNGLRHISCAVSRSTYDPYSGRARPKQGPKAKREMEKARAILSVGEEESGRVARLDVRPHRAGHAASFYEGFATRGLRVDCIRPGFLSCTFKVPPRLTDAGGTLSPGAIANLVDEVAAAVIHSEGHHMKISVDMSISYMCAVKVDDELEIISKVLGHKGGYSGTYVLLRNKATGEVVAEGRHSLFGKLVSKI
ncbi:unnamed protein product [Musa hybrid cultivar]